MLKNLAMDVKVLGCLLRPLRKHGPLEDRLERFYQHQAEFYDHFRQRLLQGRRELIEALPLASSQVWIDMGGGTGANLEFAGDRLAELKKVYVVDLCNSLLRVAEQRACRLKWKNVSLVKTDATSFRPQEGRADVVTFSYSLTMMTDWRKALDHAIDLLRPGGVLGVVDFYVSRQSHSRLTQSFWPAWFSFDGVHLSAEHLPYLRRRLNPLWVTERKSRVPYLPLLRVPYYNFLGQKRFASPTAPAMTEE